MNVPPTTVTKIMALTLADFHRSLKTLALDIAATGGQTEITVPQENGSVSISYEALEDETLGGLLALPRARVTIRFSNLDDAQAEEFLARFDQAFQRGGG